MCRSLAPLAPERPAAARRTDRSVALASTARDPAICVRRATPRTERAPTLPTRSTRATSPDENHVGAIMCDLGVCRVRGPGDRGE